MLRSVRINVKSEFCRNYDLRTEGSKRLAKQFFILERSVNFSRVEKRNAFFNCGANQRDSVLWIHRLTESEAHSHTAESERRNFQITFSKFALFHFLSSLL